MSDEYGMMNDVRLQISNCPDPLDRIHHSSFCFYHSLLLGLALMTKRQTNSLRYKSFPVAVPDLFSGSFLPPLHPSARRNLLRITSRRLLNIPAFVFSNLRQTPPGENRYGREFSDFLFGGVVVAMLYEQPLPIPGSHQNPRAF